MTASSRPVDSVRLKRIPCLREESAVDDERHISKLSRYRNKNSECTGIIKQAINGLPELDNFKDES